jgi:hypothetical protein
MCIPFCHKKQLILLAMKKNLHTKAGDIKINATISNTVRDYSNDPYFLKKDEESKIFLKQHGFPEQLLKIRKGYL